MWNIFIEDEDWIAIEKYLKLLSLSVILKS